MRKIIVILSSLAILISCNNKEKFNVICPEELGEVIFKSLFDSLPNVKGNNFVINSAIHKNSICFKSKDSSYLVFKHRIKPSSSLTIALWFSPDFFGRNGTIINLSKGEKDFPINSPLSIYMNKNRVAVMQMGADLRKKDYINQNAFTPYFMNLEELNTREIYFLVYVYTNNEIVLYIDGVEYASFENISDLDEINYVTLGASWNNKGSKYHFNGCMDDLYIFDTRLNKNQINNLMDYTHLFQYEK